MADPGFPVGGGAETLGGVTDLRRGCFSAKTYAKMKEFDPVGGGGAPPGSANEHISDIKNLTIQQFCNIFLKMKRILMKNFLAIGAIGIIVRRFVTLSPQMKYWYPQVFLRKLSLGQEVVRQLPSEKEVEPKSWSDRINGWMMMMMITLAQIAIWNS